MKKIVTIACVLFYCAHANAAEKAEKSIEFWTGSLVGINFLSMSGQSATTIGILGQPFGTNYISNTVSPTIGLVLST